MLDIDKQIKRREEELKDHEYILSRETERTAATENLEMCISNYKKAIQELKNRRVRMN